jgi:hypothetical protein
MPRQKIENPRTIIVPIRLTKRERDQISMRARDTPLSQWIRQAVFARLEMPQQDKQKPPTIQPEEKSEQAMEVQVPLPTAGEHPDDYAARLDKWIAAALPDRVARNRRYEAASAVFDQYDQSWGNRNPG